MIGAKCTSKGLRLVFYLNFCVVVLFANACAFTTEHVKLAYTPQGDVTKLEGADKVSIRVEVKDARPSPDVAYKINGFNMETAPIIADNDVPAMVKDAIETELKNRNFATGSGPVVVLAELSRFRNHFQVGFWSGTATAIVAQGVNPGIQLASGNNARIAALQDAMVKLFSDKDFVNSLIAAGTPPTAPSKSAA